MVRTGCRYFIYYFSKEGYSRKEPGVMEDPRWGVRFPARPSGAGHPRMEPRLLSRELHWVVRPVFQLVKHDGNYLWHGNGGCAWPWFLAEPTPNRHFVRARYQPLARLVDRWFTGFAFVPLLVLVDFSNFSGVDGAYDLGLMMGLYPFGSLRARSLVAVFATAADHTTSNCW